MWNQSVLLCSVAMHALAGVLGFALTDGFAGITKWLLSHLSLIALVVVMTEVVLHAPGSEDRH
jgi:hypothetical protein